MSKNNLFHCSPSIIVELRPEPMWFSYSEKISECYYDFSDGTLKYMHEYELTGGHHLSLSGAKKFCKDNDIDFDRMESELRDNPEDIYDIDGVKELAEHCDGFEHNDHSPVDDEDEIVALLVFDPSKNLRLANITNLEDEDTEKSGAMTKAGVVMGKKTHLSEGTWAISGSGWETASKELEGIIKGSFNERDEDNHIVGNGWALAQDLEDYKSRNWNNLGDDTFYDFIDKAIDNCEATYEIEPALFYLQKANERLNELKDHFKRQMANNQETNDRYKDIMVRNANGIAESIIMEATGSMTFEQWVSKYAENEKTESTGDVYYFVDPGQYQEAMDDLRSVMRVDKTVKDSYLDHGDEHPSGYGFFAFKHTINAPKPETYKNGKPKRVPTVKRGDIQGLFGDANDPTYKSDCARVKALLYLFDRQTDDEQNTESTNHHNRMGFTGTDAQLLSSFAKQVIQKAWLSPRQMQVLRTKINKYAGQMARVANVCRQEGKDGVIGEQARRWASANAKSYKKRPGTEEFYLA